MMIVFKKYFLFYLIAFLSVINISSCKTGKKAEQTSFRLEKALLWEITGPGINKPSYLYGTIHIIQSKDFFLPKGTMSAIDASKKIMFEIDMSEMSDISSLMGMMNKVFMTGGKTLKSLISEEDYKLVSNHFKKAGLPIFLLERIKPLFLTAFAYGDIDPSGLKNGNMKSYEMEFYEMAKNSGKSSGGLESIDYQISLFDEIPYEAQAKMLVDAIKTSDTNNEGFKKMTEIYLAQDLNAMASMISADESEIKGFENTLLTQRNKNWIPIIIDNIKKEQTFFAVGAGHLGGKEGVINLLKNAGLTLKPVK